MAHFLTMKTRLEFWLPDKCWGQMLKEAKVGGGDTKFVFPGCNFLTGSFVDEPLPEAIQISQNKVFFLFESEIFSFFSSDLGASGDRFGRR